MRLTSLLLIGLASCSNPQPEKEKPKIRPVEEVEEPVDSLTAQTEESWPIRVVNVELHDGKEGMWMVTTENGVLYYTNEKPRVGDVAFCLDNQDRVVDCPER